MPATMAGVPAARVVISMMAAGMTGGGGVCSASIIRQQVL